MVQHGEESHRGEGLPPFKFKVLRSFRSALDRQIAEAIRIEMRGNILNRKGEFNRCSLTRLGVDHKWEDERWAKSVEMFNSMKEDCINTIVESQELKRPGGECSSKGAKKLKLESGDKVWGGKADHLQEQRGLFLLSGAEGTSKKKQPVLPVMKGSEWMAYSLVKEMAWETVEIAFCMRDVANWEEWGPTMDDISEQIRVDQPECGTAQMHPSEGRGGKSESVPKLPRRRKRNK